MIHFTENLKKEIAQQLIEIERKVAEPLLKLQEVSALLEDAFIQLKKFIYEYTFKDESEEVLFFKYIKPEFLYDLIYHKKIYHIEINRPLGGYAELRSYFEKELVDIKNFFDKNRAFYHYYRSGRTDMDILYFSRGKRDNSLYQESFSFERDPLFSTCYDFKMAKVLANEKVENYILENLSTIRCEQCANADMNGTFRQKLTWTDKQIFLIELIYALHSAKVFNYGKATLKEIVTYFELVFNIQLGTNASRTYSDMITRKNHTSFLDKLRKLLTNRIYKEDNK